MLQIMSMNGVTVLSTMLLFFFVYYIAKLLNDIFTPYSLDHHLTETDNAALAVSFAGYLISVTIVFIGAVLGPSYGLKEDLVLIGGYSLLGILLLNVSRIINDKIMLYKFSNVKEIITDRNSGTGAVQAGAYIASGLIIAGSIQGEGGGILTALAFYLLGQVLLVLFAWIYNLITPFDVHGEIEKDNVAAGVGFGGTLIALGVILAKGVSGSFISWPENLTKLGLTAVLIFVVLIMVRFFFDKLIIPKSNLNDEIVRDQNIGAAILEMTTATSFACILFFIL